MSNSIPPDLPPADLPPADLPPADLPPADLPPVDVDVPVIAAAPPDLNAQRPAPRLAFPTLDPAAPRPVGMRYCEPYPTFGHPALFQCTCYRTVPADEMMDFRELPAAALATLGLPTYCCRDCFHTLEATGKILHLAVAVALGLDAATLASLESASRFALAKGWHATTPRNAHLAPSRL